MSTFRTSSVFDVSLARFVAVSQEPQLLDYLSKAGGLAKREVFDRVEDANTVSWKVRIAVNESMPATIKKLMGSQQLMWTNAFTMDKRTQRMTLRVVDSHVEKFLDVRGEVTLYVDAPYRTRMELVCDVRSKVPLVGKSLESFIAEKVISGWDKDCQSRAEYIRKRMVELREAGQLDESEARQWA